MTDAETARGQTNVDFALGIFVFFVALSFVVAATPQLLAPYENQETPTVAERVESTLAESLLAAGGDSSRLDVGCTGAFFNASPSSDCAFESAESLTDRVGVERTYRVNVTLRWNVTGDADAEVLCYDGGDVGACGTGPLAVGPSVPREHRSVAAERRTVLVGDQPAVLEVRVW